jgi:probable F420-dependent oxidoreductase
MGFDLLIVSDHIALVPEIQRGFAPPFYDPFATLAWLAGTTGSIELGTTVIVLPYRHPLQTARLAASIDQLSGGRLILGVAAGWSRQEFETLGVAFHRRGRITSDYLAAIKALWSSEIASFDSESVTFQDVHTGARPARDPHPPIWVGGQSPAALRRAAELGDAWHPQSVPLAWIEASALPELARLADAAQDPSAIEHPAEGPAKGWSARLAGGVEPRQQGVEA